MSEERVGSDQITGAVLKALENPKYKWRTIDGISAEAKLDPSLVRRVISEAPDQIVRSSVPSESGQALFATREHIRKVSSVGAKLLGAIKNRLI